VVRFKFTSKPGKSTIVQRRAIKRIYERFPELGIDTAGGVPLVVQPQ
jgi:hypothetical protein